MDADPVFQKALENFKKDLTDQQLQEFRITKLEDVNNEVNKIQIQHGSAKKLRGMSRMSKFLEAMQQLEQVISVFLNVSEAVAFIWGPIKFFLGVASSRLEILECLLDTFTDIAEAIPDLWSYKSIFEDQPEVLEVLQRCYGDILQFCHMAFGVLGRPGAFGIRDWRRIFDSVWKTFRTKFSPVLGSLRRHRELLVQVKLTATYGAVEKMRRELQDSIEKSNEDLKQILSVIHQKKKLILDKLGNQGSHDDKGHRRLPDQRHPTSGDWILEEYLFLQWLDPNNSLNDLLYLNGMPGAGKTTLVSRIIDGMTKDTNSQKLQLLNFYFEFGQSGKTLMTDMLRSLIGQLLQQDDAIVDDLHETVLPARPSDLNSVSWLMNLATRLLLAQKTCYIIVDGLDECALDQRKLVLQWVKTLLSESKVSNIEIKILVSGQRDGVIDAMLADCACSIKLDDQTPHLRDIKNYASSVLTQIKDQFPDLEDEKEMLQRLDPSRIANASKGIHAVPQHSRFKSKEVAKAAEGMFMYAKVVLDNFLSQTSVYELEEELGREYPLGLDQAYDRVAERVLEKSLDARKQAALKILGLVACAARPLKWREVQCYFCIDAEKGSCNPRRRKASGPKDLCSSFVDCEACTSFPDMASEARLIMVHNTAKSYLLRSGRLDMVQQHMHMSLFCFQYLTRSAFDIVSHDSKTQDDIALTGFYGFFDYATAHWDHHLLQYVRQISLRLTSPLMKEEVNEPLSRAWMDFVKRFHDGHEPASGVPPEDEVPLKNSEQQYINSATVDAKDESCNIQEIFSDWSSTRTSAEFQNLAKSIHQIMHRTELIPLEDRDKTVYRSLNGPFRPKCSQRVCLHFNTGFASEAELLHHTSWHEMAYKCTHTGCYAWRAGFRTDALLQAHLRRVHPVIDSEEKLFPVKSQKRARTFVEACRMGDIKWIQTAHILPTVADTGLLAAAREGHLAVCVHLIQRGANPYGVQLFGHRATATHVMISLVQMSIRFGDHDLFAAARSAASEQQEIEFIERSSNFLACVIDALESPFSQFLVDILAWNGRRTKPFTLSLILMAASMGSLRQQYGSRTLSTVKRQVLFEQRSVQEGLQVLLSSELERHRKCGQSPEDCYRQVLVAPDVNGMSILHCLCGSGPEYTAYMAVKFLLTQLRPEDIRLHDSEGNPPLFTALKNRSRPGGSALDDQENIIRSFFQKDSNEAKDTRNASGNDPLEFAFMHSTLSVFSLVVELCGADYKVIQSYRFWGVPSSCEFQDLLVAVGNDHIDERSRMISEFSPQQAMIFAGLLTDLEIDPEILEELEFLIHHRPQSAMHAMPEPLDHSDTFRAILHPDNSNDTKFLLSLKGAERFFEKYRSRLGDLGPAELRKLLYVCLEPEVARYDIAKTLLVEHDLDFDNLRPDEDYTDIDELAARRDMDPELVSLLDEKQSSNAVEHARFIKSLEDSISASEDAEGWGDYIQALIQKADAKRDRGYVASLEYLMFQWRN